MVLLFDGDYEVHNFHFRLLVFQRVVQKAGIYFSFFYSLNLLLGFLVPSFFRARRFFSRSVASVERSWSVISGEIKLYAWWSIVHNRLLIGIPGVYSELRFEIFVSKLSAVFTSSIMRSVVHLLSLSVASSNAIAIGLGLWLVSILSFCHRS